jgi:hypothetical protein
VRSISVGGCTHSCVVETFLREQEQKFEFEKEAIFAEIGHTFQGCKLAQKSRKTVQH